MLGGGISLYLRREKPQKVRVALAEKVDDLRAIVNGSGEIRTHNSVDVQTEIAGVIVALNVKEGDPVKKDQILLKIDPFQTEAEVRSAQSALSALEADAKGQEAQIAGSEANAARDEFLRTSAEVELRQAETNLIRSEMQFKREAELAASNLISSDQLEVTETQVTLNQAQVESAQARIKQLDAQVKAAQANVEFARAGRDSALKRVDGARAALLRSEDLLKKTTIRSTLDGVIVKLNVEEGERAVPGLLTNPQATLMTIADFSVIEAELKIDETDIVTVKLGDPAKVVVDALMETPFTGKVSEIGNSPILASSSGASQAGKDFKVVVHIEDPAAALRPGMSCEADITTVVKKDVLVIPIQALTLREVKVDAEGNYLSPVETHSSAGQAVASVREKLQELQGVFILGEDGRSHFRPVKTGIIGEMDVEVLTGLKAGDRVIVGPLKALRTLKEKDPIAEDTKHPYRRTLRQRSSEEGESGGNP